MNLFYSIMMKYKYLYSMPMTLKIKKKNFAELLYQIEKAFADSLTFKVIRAIL